MSGICKKDVSFSVRITSLLNVKLFPNMEQSLIVFFKPFLSFKERERGSNKAINSYLIERFDSAVAVYTCCIGFFTAGTGQFVFHSVRVCVNPVGGFVWIRPVRRSIQSTTL